MLEAPVIVILLSGFLPTLVVSKLLVSCGEEVGGLDELKLSLIKLA